jgi:hypothetical protein
MSFDTSFCFDLRHLALDKLMTYACGYDYIEYREATMVLGRVLHLRKGQTRILLLQMSKDNMIKFDARGKIWFTGTVMKDDQKMQTEEIPIL